MNTLVVCRPFPWPERSGKTMRMASTVRALAELGEVDVFGYVDASGRSDVEAPPAELGLRWTVETRPRSVGHTLDRVPWLLRGTLPWSLATRDHRELREAFRSWARPHYDLAWLIGAESFVAVGDLVDCPTICDLDDLEDRKLEARASVEHRGAVRGALARVDVRRWRALQARVVASADRTLVCSPDDRDRLGSTRAAVLANGYPRPAAPVGRAEVGHPPTVTMVGMFTYAPNADGARFLVGEVLPLLRTHVPDVQIRLVGQRGAELEPLARVPGVTVTGPVRSIEEELARADVAVVPIRFGGGTRIKVLEAFAHGIPVVSTTIGAEGLDAVDGEHLLLADGPAAFAAATSRLLVDADLRHRVRAAARSHWEQRFRTEAIAERVVDLATAVGAPA